MECGGEFWLNHDKLCQRKCPGSAFYWKNDTNECFNCPTNCLYCQNSTAECLVCDVGFGYNSQWNTCTKKKEGGEGSGKTDEEKREEEKELKQEEIPKVISQFFNKIETRIHIVFDKPIPEDFRPAWMDQAEISLLIGEGKSIDLKTTKKEVLPSNPNELLLYF